jgi:catechol 2,3-dioxygenase-like lactoylglutathione lyase family enzyme
MRDFDSVLLYVENVAASADFYAGLLGRKPVEASPNFAMFVMSSGMGLGLWSRSDATPGPAAKGGGGELLIKLADAEAVRACHAEWWGRGLTILQPPTAMDFGFTFTAADPDGHRLRVFAEPAG